MYRNLAVPTYKLAVGLLLVLGLMLSACGANETTSQTDSAASPRAAEAGTEGKTEADSSDVEEFYSGRTVTLIVTQPPGGGFDTYARLYAEYMPQYIPGEPTIVVENMPGAGNVIGFNYVYTAAERDGSVFATGEPPALQQLFDSEGVLFDVSELQYIGMPDEPVNMLLVARNDSGYSEADQLYSDMANDLRVGVSVPGSSLADAAILLAEVTDANIEIIPGYEGSSALALALEQGEIEAALFSSATLESDYSHMADEWTPLLQTAEADAPNAVDGIPSILDIAEDPDDKQLLGVGTTYRAYVRPYFLPPDVPAERFEALKEAWERASQDPELIAAAEEAGRPVSPVPGERLQEVFTSYIRDTPPAVIQKLQEALQLEL